MFERNLSPLKYCKYFFILVIKLCQCVSIDNCTFHVHNKSILCSKFNSYARPMRIQSTVINTLSESLWTSVSSKCCVKLGWAIWNGSLQRACMASKCRPACDWEATRAHLEAVDAVELDGEVDGRHVEAVAQRRVGGSGRIEQRREQVRVAALDRYVQRRVALAVLRVHQLLEVRRHCGPTVGYSNRASTLTAQCAREAKRLVRGTFTYEFNAIN